MPVFGAGGEESLEPKGGVFDLVNVEHGEVALAGGGDIEAEAAGEWSVGVRGRGGARWVALGLRRGKHVPEILFEELMDAGLAGFFGGGAELAKEAQDIGGFEVDAVDRRS